MLTALMPLRNFHEPYLRQSIASMFGQTSPAWRLSIIVEPEDERTFSRLLEQELRDERVVLIANEGRGLAGALNTGMRRAATDFTAILLSDDLWAEEAVATLLDAIARFPDFDFFHSSRRIVDEQGRSVSSIYDSTESFELDHFVETSPVKHLLCWRRELALSIGGIDETLPPVGPDDYDFPWCMAEAGARFRALAECLYLYRDHRESFRLTTHLPLETHRLGIRRILEKHGVSAERIERRLEASENGYLKQCLFTTAADREQKERSGFDPRGGWREPYR
jgi:glycosyltransferase involved in cell wall biosynthesis